MRRAQLIGFCLLAAVGTAQGGRPRSIAPKDSLNRSIVRGNDFTSSRDLAAYKTGLGSFEFSKSLEKICQTKGTRWLDAGGGDGVATREFLGLARSKAKASHGASFVPEITIASFKSIARSRRDLKVMRNRFIEDIPNAALGSYDLITDVMGPLAYTDRPDKVTQKYWDCLKPGGEAYVFLGEQGVPSGFGERNLVIGSNGLTRSYMGWLKSLKVPGLQLREVELSPGGLSARQVGTVLYIKKPMDAASFRFPGLSSMSSQANERPYTTPVQILAEQSSADGLRSLMTKELKREDRLIRRTIQAKNLDQVVKALSPPRYPEAIKHKLEALRKDDVFVYSGRSAAPIRDWRAQRSKAGLVVPNVLFVDASQGEAAPTKRPIGSRVATVGSGQSVRQQLQQHSGKAKLIVDHYGRFASESPTAVLSDYLDSLDEQGTLRVALGYGYNGYMFSHSTIILTRDGKRCDLQTWLKSLPGLQVTFEAGNIRTQGKGAYGIPRNNSLFFATIRIKDRDKIRIPSLRLVGIQNERLSSLQDDPVSGRVFVEE